MQLDRRWPLLPYRPPTPCLAVWPAPIAQEKGPARGATQVCSQIVTRVRQVSDQQRAKLHCTGKRQP